MSAAARSHLDVGLPLQDHPKPNLPPGFPPLPLMVAFLFVKPVATVQPESCSFDSVNWCWSGISSQMSRAQYSCCDSRLSFDSSWLSHCVTVQLRVSIGTLPVQQGQVFFWLDAAWIKSRAERPSVSYTKVTAISQGQAISCKYTNIQSTN